MSKVTFRHCEPVRVVALRHKGEYQTINTTFEHLAGWAEAQDLLNGNGVRCFAIYYDDPMEKPAAELNSDACLSVPEGFHPKAPYNITHTPGGRCAELIHVGPYADLPKAWDWLYTEWLPQSGETPADQPPIEEYLNDARITPSAELETAIRIPLREK